MSRKASVDWLGCAAMPSALKRAAKAAAAKLNVEIGRPGPNRHAQRAVLLRHLGVDLVLDVGANVGQYAGIHLREWTEYDGRIASFEPVSGCYAQCAAAAQADADWVTLPYGLSDAEQTASITVPAGQEDLSSLHGFTEAGGKMIETTTTSAEQVPLRRLDDVIGDIAKPDDRLALKIDVQGHEAAVLRGAARTLERVVLVECEMPLVRMYDSQETFAELLATLSAAGFAPVGMQSNYVDPASGYAMDADVFLVRLG
jgi:FkbM family methyltransferase